MPDLYPAQIDGFELEIEMLDDDFEKSIVRHEYPYRNGALLEDLGQRARVVRCRCHFWDDGSDHATYDLHTDFLEHLDSMEVFELVHPKYGPMRGSVEAVHVAHDDRDQWAEVDITFVEGRIESVEEQANDDVEAGVEESYLASIEEQKIEFGDDVFAALGSEADSILGFELDPDLGIVEQFSGITTTARQYLKKVDSYVGLLEGTLNAVANPANSLISIINYGTSLPGRVIGSVARCVERYALLAEGLRTAPAMFADSLSSSLDTLEDASAAIGVSSSASVSAVAGGSVSGADAGATFAKTTRIGGAAQIALQVASCYKEDEVRRSERKRVERQTSFDVLGNYTAPGNTGAELQPMTVRELESSLATVREMLQEAVELSRETTSLKKMALQLQSHVGTIKLEREKTVRIRLGDAVPLHLVCLQCGLPYTVAERLLAINEIKNPNEVLGEIDMLTEGAAINRSLLVEETDSAGDVLMGGEVVTFGGVAVVM